MAGTKISALPAGANMGAGDLFVIVQGGVTVKLTPAQVAAGVAAATHFTFDSAGHMFANIVGIPASSNLLANVTSVTPAGNDVRGTFTIVIGAAGIAAGASICTITFAGSYGATAPYIHLTDMTGSLLNVGFSIKSQSTGVSFVLGCGQAMAVGTYICSYIVLG